MYRKVSNISCTKSQNLNDSLAVVFALSIQVRCLVENEYVVGAAPTGDAPTTSEWSTIWLPTKVRLILEDWRYVNSTWDNIIITKHPMRGTMLPEGISQSVCEVTA